LIRVAEAGAPPEIAGKTMERLAAERGMSPFNVMCEVALANDFAIRFEVTFANDDEKGVEELLLSDGCIVGLSDAGAHVSQICDAVLPTDFLAHWVRDRGVMSIEAGIHKLTGELGRVLGVDRGCLRAGAPADVVVLDLASLAVGPIRRVNDMPAGGERLIADAPRGIAHVIVNGVPVCRDGALLDDVRPGAIVSSRSMN
jgi:N-acyl-D-aspartate/D-glutamate deacylase